MALYGRLGTVPSPQVLSAANEANNTSIVAGSLSAVISAESSLTPVELDKVLDTIRENLSGLKGTTKMK